MILDETKRDILAEMINVGLGQAAGMLNEMIGLPVTLEIPSVDLLPPEEIERLFEEKFGEHIAAVSMGFHGGFDGTATMLFPPENALKIVAAMNGDLQQVAEADEVIIQDDWDPEGDLEEIGNVLMNSVMGAIANGLQRHLEFGTPKTRQETVHSLVEQSECFSDSRILIARTGFGIEYLSVAGSITRLVQVGSVDKLLAALQAAEDAD